ncbi:MAG: CinA family protein [Pseudomonadota bacterium]
MNNQFDEQIDVLEKGLISQSLKLVTAESCTGGGLAELLTQRAGASAWFERGFVTYSNEAKQELLNVQHDTLLQYGAVSEATAAEMVRGAVDNSHAQLGVSITGIAGPDGGSEEKPVGTVCLGWGDISGEVKTTRVVFSGDRNQIRLQACQIAIQGLIESINKITK